MVVTEVSGIIALVLLYVWIVDREAAAPGEGISEGWTLTFRSLENL